MEQKKKKSSLKLMRWHKIISRNSAHTHTKQGTTRRMQMSPVRQAGQQVRFAFLSTATFPIDRPAGFLTSQKAARTTSTRTGYIASKANPFHGLGMKVPGRNVRDLRSLPGSSGPLMRIESCWRSGLTAASERFRPGFRWPTRIQRCRVTRQLPTPSSPPQVKMANGNNRTVDCSRWTR